MGLSFYDMRKLQEEVAELMELEQDDNEMFALLYLTELENKYNVPIEEIFEIAGVVFADA